MTQVGKTPKLNKFTNEKFCTKYKIRSIHGSFVGVNYELRVTVSTHCRTYFRYLTKTNNSNFH